MTKNMIEKPVLIPPGICNDSVIRLAKGLISFLQKIPSTQQRAMKLNMASFEYFIVELLLKIESIPVSRYTPVANATDVVHASIESSFSKEV
jgi:hypothetical protein